MQRKIVEGKKKQGFTLIELMVVLAIIGGLIAVLSGSVFKKQAVARKQTAKIQLSAIKGSIETFHTDKERYPKSLDELKKNGYKIKLEDPWGYKIRYIPIDSEDGEKIIRYNLFSVGKDGKVNTRDDINTEKNNQDDGDNG